MGLIRRRSAVLLTATILAGAAVGVAATALGLSIIGSVGWMLVAGFNWLIGMP